MACRAFAFFCRAVKYSSFKRGVRFTYKLNQIDCESQIDHSRVYVYVSLQLGKLLAQFVVLLISVSITTVLYLWICVLTKPML